MGFGKSKQNSTNSSQQTSNSSNQAFPFLQGAFGGLTGMASEGSNAIANLLGLGGREAQTEGFDNFRASSGYNFLRDEAIDGVTSSNAAKGLLGSGSTLKAIQDRSSNLASSFLDRYLSSLSGLSNTGLQAGNIIGGAGNQSDSQGTSTGISSGKSINFSFG